MEFLIVCPLAMLAGFVDAIAGGGGLISLPACMIAGLPPQTAIATNKLLASIGTVFSTSKYIRNGYVVWSIALFCVITAVLGSMLGANLALLADETILQWVMLIAVPIVGIYMFFNKGFGQTFREGFSKKATIAIAMAISFVMGVYDGFYGPGTGTFLLMLLTMVARLDLKTAAGTTKVINLTTNLGSLVIFLINGAVLIPLGLTAGAFCAAGHILGARCFSSNGAKVVRPIILVVVVIFMIKLIYDMFF